MTVEVERSDGEKIDEPKSFLINNLETLLFGALNPFKKLNRSKICFKI